MSFIAKGVEEWQFFLEPKRHWQGPLGRAPLFRNAPPPAGRPEAAEPQSFDSEKNMWIRTSLQMPVKAIMYMARNLLVFFVR